MKNILKLIRRFVITIILSIFLLLFLNNVLFNLNLLNLQLSFI